MKKNNYTLSSGILLVIASSICILMAMVYMFVLFIAIQYVTMYGYEIADADKAVYTLEILFYAGMILFKVAQAVTFMLLGIKLISKGKKGIPTQNCKGLVITTLVLSFVCAFIDMTTVYLIEGGLFLATGIILSCGLGKRQYDIRPNLTGATQSPVNVQPVFNQEITKVETNNLDDNLSSQVKALQELRDKNVIDSEEYLKMLQKVVGVNLTTQEKSKKENSVVKETKYTTTRVKKLTQKPNSKDNKE